MKRAVLFVLAAGLSWALQPAQGQVLFVASLTGAQETPAVTTQSQGTAWAVLSADKTTITFGLTYAQLSAAYTASHFHVAAAGVPGGVVHGFAMTGNTITGTWTGFPDSIVTHLFAGEVYVNVHSTAHTGGEIRGQLMPAFGRGYIATLTGDQETPPTGSSAMGTGWAVLDSNGTSLSYRATVAGLATTVTGSHIHDAPPGVPGSVIHGITFVDSTTEGVWSAVPSVYGLESLKENLYMNVHTTAHSGGEIRGQLLGVEPNVFRAALTGAQETPAVTTQSQGTAWAVLSADKTTITFGLTYAQLSAAYTASHFHVAAAGVPGGVVHGFAMTGNTIVGTWTSVPDSIVTHLFAGEVYVNVHSTAHTGGEIRGQLAPSLGLAYTTTLTGDQETPPTGSSAMGTAWAVLDSNGTSLSYRATVAGLATTVTASHFHDGAPGVPGGVIHGITFTDSTTEGVWSAVPSIYDPELLVGNLYMNVHTTAHTGGEIRGQFGPLAGTVTGVAEPAPALPGSFALSQNYPNPFNPSTTIAFQLSSSAFVTLTVYDVLGREVATLVNSQLPAGSHQVRFNAGNLASGIYFYRMHATTGSSGQSAVFSKVAKMVLVK